MWEFWTRKDPYEGMPTFQVRPFVTLVLGFLTNFSCNFHQIIFSVGTEGLRPPIPHDCPADYAKLMTDCWQVEPELRPGYDTILQRLEDLR